VLRLLVKPHGDVLNYARHVFDELQDLARKELIPIKLYQIFIAPGKVAGGDASMRTIQCKY
jgi:hypothetical protein